MPHSQETLDANGDKSGQVVNLVYGLKQASRHRAMRLDDAIVRTIGMEQCMVVPYVFRLTIMCDIVVTIVCIHVVDITVVAGKSEACDFLSTYSSS